MPLFIGLLVGVVALVAVAPRSEKATPPASPAPATSTDHFVRSPGAILEPGVEYVVAAYCDPLPSRALVEADLGHDWTGGRIVWYPGEGPKAFPENVVGRVPVGAPIVVTRGVWKGSLLAVDSEFNV